MKETKDIPDYLQPCTGGPVSLLPKGHALQRLRGISIKCVV